MTVNNGFQTKGARVLGRWAVMMHVTGAPGLVQTLTTVLAVFIYLLSSFTRVYTKRHSACDQTDESHGVTSVR